MTAIEHPTKEKRVRIKESRLNQLLNAEKKLKYIEAILNEDNCQDDGIPVVRRVMKLIKSRRDAQYVLLSNRLEAAKERKKVKAIDDGR
jgi:hypothetical protein